MVAVSHFRERLQRVHGSRITTLLLKCKLLLSNSGSHNSSSRALVPDLSISISSPPCLEFVSRLPAQGDTDVINEKR